MIRFDRQDVVDGVDHGRRQDLAAAAAECVVDQQVGLVDTGADNSIFPLSVATDLGIETVPGKGPGPTAFGGQQIALPFAEVVLELTQEDTSIRWRARLYFAEFPNDSEKAVILGQEGFLDYFTATFIGEDCVLVLEPNKSIPLV